MRLKSSEYVAKRKAAAKAKRKAEKAAQLEMYVRANAARAQHDALKLIRDTDLVQFIKLDIEKETKNNEISQA